MSDRRLMNKIADRQGYSGCYRCGDTWERTLARNVKCGERNSCFPICARCYLALKPAERLPYFERLFDEWLQQSPDDADRERVEQMRLVAIAEVLADK